MFWNFPSFETKKYGWLNEGPNEIALEEDHYENWPWHPTKSPKEYCFWKPEMTIDPFLVGALEHIFVSIYFDISYIFIYIYISSQVTNSYIFQRGGGEKPPTSYSNGGFHGGEQRFHHGLMVGGGGGWSTTINFSAEFTAATQDGLPSRAAGCASHRGVHSHEPSWGYPK